MKTTATTLASLALITFSSLISAKPIILGEDADRTGSGNAVVADPQLPQVPRVSQNTPAQQAQVNIRILKYRPETIEINPPDFESVNLNLDPVTHSGEAQFSPVQLVGAIIGRSTYPVSCTFILDDGTTDENWVLNSQSKRSFMPREGNLQDVTGVKCSKANDKEESSFPETFGNSLATSSGSGSGFGSDRSTNDNSPLAPFSPNPASSDAAGPQRNGFPQITYLVPQVISGKTGIEIPLTERRGSSLYGRVFWDDDGTIARVLQGIWYSGPQNAKCQLITGDDSTAPEQALGEGLDEPIVAVGVHCWSSDHDIQ